MSEPEVHALEEQIDLLQKEVMTLFDNGQGFKLINHAITLQKSVKIPGSLFLFCSKANKSLD